MITISQFESFLKEKLHGEFSSLILSFNDMNAPNYQTVEQFFTDYPFDCNEDWISSEEKQRAFETNSLWRIQWYPNTPVGFCAMQASSLSALIEAFGREK